MVGRNKIHLVGISIKPLLLRCMEPWISNTKINSIMLLTRAKRLSHQEKNVYFVTNFSIRYRSKYFPTSLNRYSTVTSMAVACLPIDTVMIRLATPSRLTRTRLTVATSRCSTINNLFLQQTIALDSPWIGFWKLFHFLIPPAEIYVQK